MTLVAQLVRFIYQSEGRIDPEELAEVQAVEASAENERDIPPRLPGEPTQHLPGSEEKVRVMMARASRGEQLFHPLDRQGTGTTASKEDTSVRPPRARKLVLPRDHVPTEEGGLSDDWTV